MDYHIAGFCSIAGLAICLWHWYRHREAHRGSTHAPDSQSGLEKLPAELCYEVEAYLSPQDRAALALVSRTALFRLGRASLQLQGASRLDLLIRLERDGVSISDILCRRCQIFHPPDSSSSRECAKFANVRSDSLPDQLHFNKVAAVMRSYRHQSTVHTAQQLSSRSWCQGESGYPRLLCHTDCEIIGGRLIAKTEQLIIIRMGLEGLVDDTVKMLKLLASASPSPQRVCCLHYEWTVLYDFVFHTYPRSTHKGKQHRYIWTSPYSRLYRLSHELDLFRVGGCIKCHTDIALGVIDLPGNGGRVVVSTTWKDLGRGEDVEDPKWKSTYCKHLVAEGTREMPDRQKLRNDLRGLPYFVRRERLHQISLMDSRDLRRRADVGDIFRAFEGAPAGLDQYLPKISPADVEYLAGQG